ncbi:hypothetical protein BDZ94DRAFT_1246823 [Collybia nuda]|uniref:MYND-type domain-containing protein n=1 Tax=Collybia nuda TaxID=64659 RepID=A0A9P5YFS0_9AGAR|nr:hypothetical protein BDZ94DRAFT_1246823 [Collybia nuda]
MNSSVNVERIPPFTANIGQACYNCFKGEDEEITLQKCAKCRAVKYCGAACQKENWGLHKKICKALNITEKNPMSRLASIFSLADAPVSNLYDLNAIIETSVQNDLRALQGNIGRHLTVPERNLIAWEPRCMGCGRSDRIMRIEAASEDAETTTTPKILKSCSDCKMAFYCSDSHWEAVQHKHAGEPSEDGRDGLSQCQLNQEIRVDVKFALIMGSKADEFRWAPERVKSQSASLKNTSWEDEFGSDLAQQFRIPISAAGSWIRAASKFLSMSMTILWALENLNQDDAWTRQDTLTIHILGAYQIEIMNAQTFEEILHRLPEVKTLKFVLCGPELTHIGITSQNRGRIVGMETCSNCKTSGRKRLHQHFNMEYHTYATSLGHKFIKPDLAVAFNSGCSQEAVSSWKDTISFLVKNKITSVFTAYNREEAEEEAQIMRQAGAKLVPIMGPIKNVWGSTLLIQEPNKVTGFYAVNGWLAGGFK